ncbi:TlpA disulfide reductase family protein [Chryseolinea lacunae]|uniref:AhpC/TSA family protein n=1 Tax=Chryseolinea lacunae TaxID=2801331 RepID=A0ABS1KSU3_9BACT|nr:TlpA disulfide reductase family protein [Chryseolinea lacunae]MBL0742531.1 AhpC/TSA family protein [Chryseolinea lacunae]
MLKLFPLGLLLLVVFSCKKESSSTNGSITLTGNVTGFADSTWIFLRQGDTAKDSARIVGGKFLMTIALPDSVPAVQMLLHTKDYSAYRFLWVEHNDLVVEGEKTKFRQAHVTGSVLETDSESLQKHLSVFDERGDSLMTLLRTPQHDTTGIGAKMRKTRHEREQAEIQFLRDHPASLVSAYVLSVMGSTYGRETTAELFNGFTAPLKQSQFGKEIERYLRLAREINVGGKFADFEMADSAGNKHKLSDLHAKVVLLEFWASWCGPCRQENPNLVKTYKEFKDKGFAILGVSLDDKRKYWLDAIKKDSLPWMHVSDLLGRNNEAALIYGVNGIPENFLIGEDGTILASSLRGEGLRTRLKELLH